MDKPSEASGFLERFQAFSSWKKPTGAERDIISENQYNCWRKSAELKHYWTFINLHTFLYKEPEYELPRTRISGKALMK